MWGIFLFNVSIKQVGIAIIDIVVTIVGDAIYLNWRLPDSRFLDQDAPVSPEGKSGKPTETVTSIEDEINHVDVVKRCYYTGVCLIGVIVTCAIAMIGPISITEHIGPGTEIMGVKITTWTEWVWTLGIESYVALVDVVAVNIGRSIVCLWLYGGVPIPDVWGKNELQILSQTIFTLTNLTEALNRQLYTQQFEIAVVCSLIKLIGVYESMNHFVTDKVFVSPSDDNDERNENDEMIDLVIKPDDTVSRYEVR